MWRHLLVRSTQKQARLLLQLNLQREIYSTNKKRYGVNSKKYWLARLYLRYQAPRTCKAIGAALLSEATDMGDADAQYELGHRLSNPSPKILTKKGTIFNKDPMELAKEQHEIAVKAGSNLGLKWLKILEDAAQL
ncbi:hypothetical protein MKX01_040149 [Papaver californicum]|nr:hypothetical protein MKX01_040149 [Papaver californicum]